MFMDPEKNSYTKLLSVSYKEILKLKQPPYSALASSTPNAWSMLCHEHFKITPLSSQNAEQLFWHTYYLRSNPIDLTDEGFQRALEFGHHDALISAYSHCTKENQLSEALQYAQRLSKAHFSLGYMLQVKVHVLLAEKSPDNKTDHCRAAEIAFRLAIKFYSHNDSQQALLNAKIALNEAWVEAYNRRLRALDFTLTKLESEQIENEVAQIYDKENRQPHESFELSYKG